MEVLNIIAKRPEWKGLHVFKSSFVYLNTPEDENPVEYDLNFPNYILIGKDYNEILDKMLKNTLVVLASAIVNKNGDKIDQEEFENQISILRNNYIKYLKENN